MREQNSHTFSRILQGLLGLGCCLAASHCVIKKTTSFESYGLTTVQIQMDSENLSQLNSTIWAKRPVNATIKVTGEEIPVVLNYAGKSTLDAFKKSYQVEILDGRKFQGRTSFRLSSQAIDPTALRSQVGFAVYQELGLPSPTAQPVSLYLDKDFQGLYQLIETVDEEFFALEGTPITALYKAKYSNASFDIASANNLDEGLTVRYGPEGYTDVKFLIEHINALPDPEALAKVESILDIDNFMTYTAATVLLKNWDGFVNNFFLFRRKADKKFGFAPWDLDRVYEPEPTRRPYEPDKSLWGYNRISQKLLQVEPYRKRYLDTLQQSFQQIPLSRIFELIDQHINSQASAFAADRVLSARGNSIQAQGQVMKDVASVWHKQIQTELTNKLEEYP